MKRFLASILSMVFVLGFAVSAFALHATIPAETTPVVAPKGTEVRLGGEIRIRGWLEDNIRNDTGARNATTGYPYAGDSMSWYDQRVRLLIDAKTAANVTGRVHLETANETWTWGTPYNLAAGNPNFAGNGVGMNILEAWIAYTGSGLLGVPTGIKLGHQLIVIGEGTFFDHRRRGDDAILLWVEPLKGTEITLVTAKLFEGATTGRLCASGTIVTYRTTACLAGESTIQTFTTTGGAIDNSDDVDAYSLIATQKIGKDHTVGLNYTYVPQKSTGMKLHNLGILGKGKVSGIGYRVTGDIQFGNIRTGVKSSGLGITVGADYKIDPVTLRANFVYGSGDDNDTDSKNKGFVTYVGNVIDPNLPTVVYNWRVMTAANSLGTGISNTTAFNLGLTTGLIKDMTAHLDYYLLRASKNAGSKSVGSEVDLKLSYKLSRNFIYSINSGILFAGNFYNGGTTATEPKSALVFQHQVVWSF